MQPRSLISFVLASVAGIAACGDDKGAPDAFNSVIDSPPGTIDAPKGPSVNKAVVVAGDFGGISHPGQMSTVTVEATPTIVTDVAATGAIDDDPVLRHFGNELFVVNRGLNNVTLLNDKTYAVIDQLSTGSSSNPQDVTIADGKLYVPIYGGTGVAVLTRATGSGSASTKVIDLGSDDLDGHPNCASAYAVGTDVYVTCQLLDAITFTPEGSGEVLVIDATTDTVRTKFRLQTQNPIGLLEATADGNLAVGTSVGFGSGSGCIEKISVGATPTSTCLVQNSLLGGYASRYQFANGLVYAAVENFDGSAGVGKLVSYDLSSTVTPISPAGQTIGDLVFCPGGDIVVSDTATPAGLRLYSGSTNQEIASGPEPVGISPKSGHGLVCY